MTKRSNPTSISKTLRLILVCGLLLGMIGLMPVQAIPLPSEGPKRTVTLDLNYTTYEYWLLSWQTSQVVCQIYVEHESLPDPKEVLYFCGSNIQNQWLRTGPCLYEGSVNTPQDCLGLYLHLANVTPSTRKVEVVLPPAEVFISLANCNALTPGGHCTSLPFLRFEALEPLPNEQIVQILGTYNGTPFTCPGGICDLPLAPTGMEGLPITFWAESTYGDASEHYTARVRVIPWGDFADPDQTSPDEPTYYVDVLSSQWKGSGTSTCAEVWQSFQPVAGPSSWLQTPELVDQLISKNDYYLLAGMLIKQGLVKADNCPYGGLESNGAANACGMELAEPLVEVWQNQFDAEIIRVAKDTSVPAQMMKNIFSKESQFWPGIYEKVKEAGLGQLSELGADTVLLWNPAFYTQFCPLVLTEQTCQRGFGNLDIKQQEMLRGALVQKVNANCPDCPTGIDLTQANFSISLFARSILANCEQVNRVVFNQTGRSAGEVVAYEDLWKFTMYNYNAGAGCLSDGVYKAMVNGLAITWENVSKNFTPICQAGIGYVEDISEMPVAQPTTIADLLATPVPTQIYYTPTPTATATPLFQPTATRTPTPTITPIPFNTPTPTSTQGTYN